MTTIHEDLTYLYVMPFPERKVVDVCNDVLLRYTLDATPIPITPHEERIGTRLCIYFSCWKLDVPYGDLWCNLSTLDAIGEPLQRDRVLCKGGEFKWNFEGVLKMLKQRFRQGLSGSEKPVYDAIMARVGKNGIEQLATKLCNAVAREGVIFVTKVSQQATDQVMDESTDKVVNHHLGIYGDNVYTVARIEDWPLEMYPNGDGHWLALDFESRSTHAYDFRFVLMPVGENVFRVDQTGVSSPHSFDFKGLREAFVEWHAAVMREAPSRGQVFTQLIRELGVKGQDRMFNDMLKVFKMEDGKFSLRVGQEKTHQVMDEGRECRFRPEDTVVARLVNNRIDADYFKDRHITIGKSYKVVYANPAYGLMSPQIVVTNDLGYNSNPWSEDYFVVEPRQEKTHQVQDESISSNQAKDFKSYATDWWDGNKYVRWIVRVGARVSYKDKRCKVVALHKEYGPISPTATLEFENGDIAYRAYLGELGKVVPPITQQDTHQVMDESKAGDRVKMVDLPANYPHVFKIGGEYEIVEVNKTRSQLLLKCDAGYTVWVSSGDTTPVIRQDKTHHVMDESYEIGDSKYKVGQSVNTPTGPGVIASADISFETERQAWPQEPKGEMPSWFYSVALDPENPWELTQYWEYQLMTSQQDTHRVMDESQLSWRVWDVTNQKWQDVSPPSEDYFIVRDGLSQDGDLVWHLGDEEWKPFEAGREVTYYLVIRKKTLQPTTHQVMDESLVARLRAASSGKE